MDELQWAIQRAKWCPKTNGHTPQPKPEPVAPDNRIYELERRIRRLEEKLANPDRVKDISARLNIAGIKNLVCDFYRVTEQEIISDQRHKNVMEPRQVAIYIACVKTVCSLPLIGKHFGGRDHSTIIHARDKIEALRLVDPKLDAIIVDLMARLDSDNAAS